MTDDTEDNDLRHYLPGRERARELADTGAAAERIARALGNPALRVAQDDPASEAAPQGETAPASEGATQRDAALASEGATLREVRVVPTVPIAPSSPKVSRGRVGRGDREVPSIPAVTRRAPVAASARPMSAVAKSTLGALAVIVPVGLALMLWPRPGQESGSAASSATSSSVSSTGSIVHALPAVTMAAEAASIGGGAPTTTAAEAMTGAPVTTGDPVGDPRKAAGAAPHNTATGAPLIPQPKIKPKPPSGPNPAQPIPLPSTVPSSPPTSSAPPDPTGPAPRYTDPDF